MLIEIKNRNGEIIITGEYGNVKDACEKSKTLRTLRDADLTGADLRGADLRGAEGITLPVITITGSIHSVFYMDGKIIIGCVEKTVAEWILDHEKTGKENNYTDAQIKEYKKYIDLIAMHEKDKT